MFGVCRSRPSHPHVQGLPLHACPTGIPTNGVPSLSEKAQVWFPHVHEFMFKFLSRIFLKDSDTEMVTFQMAPGGPFSLRPQCEFQTLTFLWMPPSPSPDLSIFPSLPVSLLPSGLRGVPLVQDHALHPHSGSVSPGSAKALIHDLLPLFPVPPILSCTLPILVSHHLKKKKKSLQHCVSPSWPAIFPAAPSQNIEAASNNVGASCLGTLPPGGSGPLSLQVSHLPADLSPSPELAQSCSSVPRIAT